ncbi:MAG: DMT family transporter [Coriobacteriia bacterium]
MLTALLGAATAVLFGSGDFFGGLASRRSPALAVTGVVYVVGMVAFAVFLLFVRPEQVTRVDLLWGAASGVAGTVGIVSLYAALAIGRMSIVAPITAALSGAGPAIFDLVRGSHVGPITLVGLALALVSVIIVSTTTGTVEEHGMPPLAVGLSVLAGASFACSLVSLSLTLPASGFAPLLIARTVGTVIMAIALIVRRRDMKLDREAVRMALGAGLLDATANVVMLSAIRIGPLAVAAVVGGLYPVATMLLARMVLGERLKRHQAFGVAMALAAVVLTALP